MGKKSPGKSAKRSKAATRVKATRRQKLPAQPIQKQPNGDSFPVVGIGASAGGLEALSQFLEEFPSDCGVALVVVQHLAPGHASLLPELLRGSTQMPVVQVSEGMKIRPDQVYVIPPDAHMEIVGGTLRLMPRPTDRTQHMPIDHFFRSLSSFGGGRAIAIILSGTASDGAKGIFDIKAAGGTVLVQDPKTAKHDGMPYAAIATGLADSVMGPRELAQELARLAKHPFIRHARPRTLGDEIPLLDSHLQRIFGMLRNSSGVDFTHYKQPTIKRRLQRRMVLHKLNTVEQYTRYLQQNPAELQSLYQDLLIHVTRFFREPTTFETLAKKVFPEIVKSRENEPVRIWIPGCSTGEEPYSIAIALLEFLGDEANSVPVQIFATDISERAIEQARTGIYSDTIISDVSPERLRRFFTRVDGGYRVSKPVRDTCIFARQDLTRDPPFSKLDLIVCRNVLIYLGPVLQKRLMTVFHYALKHSGFLMLGGSETIGPHSDLFALADKRHKLYIKKSASSRLGFTLNPSIDYPLTRGEMRKLPAESRTTNSILNEANRILLNRYAPPGVIIDGGAQIIQFRGQTGPFLEPAPGDASLNLLKMAREGLLYDLRKALHDARKGEQPVRRRGLHVRQNGNAHEVNLEIIPLVVSGQDRHFLVLFEIVPPGATEPVTAPPPRGKRASKLRPERSEQKLQRLQQELAASREYLQSIIQDLEAANEELQSANEEILSSNEELQSTNEELDTAKEELQSTNEELNTVNEELQGRNEELSRVNSDLVNLLSSVQIAIVMVASDLRIRRFTPMAEKVLNLIPSDVGRPISDIKPNIDCPQLEEWIVESIDTMSVKEREVKDRSGARFAMRVRPYKNVENKIDGAVIALFNVNDAGRGHIPAPIEPDSKL